MKVQLNARNRAYEFDAAPGEKILFAGLRARVDLPYECGTGTCGTCKARLVDGRIDDGWPEAPGRKYLKGAGEFLMCQCAAASDVTAEVASFVYPADSGAFPVADVAGVVAGARALTPDVMAFEVEVSPNAVCPRLTVDPDAQSSWNLRSFSPRPQYVAAVALDRDIEALEFFDWSADALSIIASHPSLH